MSDAEGRVHWGLAPTAVTRYIALAMFASREYRNLIATEKELMTRIQANGIKDKDLAACARVLVSVVDMKRVLRMRPKPKDVDTTKQQPRRRAAANVAALPLTLAPEPSATSQENTTSKESLSEQQG